MIYGEITEEVVVVVVAVVVVARRAVRWHLPHGELDRIWSPHVPPKRKQRLLRILAEPQMREPREKFPRGSR